MGHWSVSPEPVSRVRSRTSWTALMRDIAGAVLSAGVLAGILVVGLQARGVVTAATTSTAGLSAPLGAGAGSRTATELKADAATVLETALAKGGAGVTFEIVQRSTMHAKEGGPKIEVPDPVDRTKSLGLADEYPLGSLIERGAVTPDGFWMEMRTGPAPGAEPDWAAEYQFGAIVRDGKTWRNDGEGWYETDTPPGIGLDPRTAALLPQLLRNATEPSDEGTTSLDGRSVRQVDATGRVADVPGIVAVDGEAFTELKDPLEFSFDDQGRLVAIRSVARNTNVTDFDLLVETVIELAYPAAAEPLPEPSPVLTRTAPIVIP